LVVTIDRGGLSIVVETRDSWVRLAFIDLIH